MPSFRFLHAADLHLDTPFSGVGRVAPHVQRELQDASLRSWDALVDLALKEDVAFVVLAGDLYDCADRRLRAQLRVRDGLRRLSEARIETFVVHGNHDPLDGWQAIAANGWPSRVTICPAGEVTSKQVLRDGEHLATLHGISYAKSKTMVNLARRFPEAKDGGFHVGVLHATVGQQPDHGNYAPCTIDDLRRPGYDYWALGHIHRHAVLATAPHVVYAGSLQGRSPKPPEQGAKGALIVDVEGDEIVGEPRHVPLDHMRFVDLEVDVTDSADIASVVDDLLQTGRRLTVEHQERGLVLRATLTGGTSPACDLRREGAMNEIRSALREADDEARPLRWWDQVIDTTRPQLDRQALRSQESFLGSLVRRVDAVVDEPPALDLPGGWLADLDRDLDGRIRGRGTTFAVNSTAELRDAETLALMLLTKGEPS